MKKIKIENIDETIYEFTSKSGLKVYIWPYNLSKEISLSLTVKYGSMHTDYKVGDKEYHMPKGMAHFLEHIKFNEKNGVTAHDYYGKIASYVNAYTTYNRTSYEVVCNDNLDKNLNHLLYFVLNPYFTKSLVEKEKGIITSEAKMTLDDPYNYGYQKLLNNLYYYDNKKYLVTGNPSDIQKITLQDAKDTFKHFYHPENMFLTVTGNVNVKQVEKIVNSFFEEYKNENYIPVKMINKDEKDGVKNEGCILKANVSRDKLFVGYKIPKNNFIFDDLKTKLLLNILLSINFGTASDFNDNLINKGIIDDLYYSTYLDPLHIVIIFEASSDCPEKALKEIKNKFLHLSTNENDFIRKTKSLIALLILNYEDPSDVNEDIRQSECKYNKIYPNLKSIYESLSVTDLNYLRNFIQNGNMTSVILKPKE